MPPRTSAARRVDADAEAQRHETEEQTPRLESSRAGTVTIACRLPNGHILQLYDMVDGTEQSPLGMRTTKVSQKKGDPVKLNGPAYPVGVIPGHTIQHGYGLTPGVPKDFWEEWLKQNKDSDLIASRTIFASENQEKVTSQAKEQSREKVPAPHMSKGHVIGVPSGLEALDRKNLPKVGLGMRISNAGDKNPNDKDG